MEKTPWKIIKKTYKNEWIAVVNYEPDGPADIKGVVVLHDPNKAHFHQKVKALVKKYGDIAIRYTGEQVKNPEVPLLWQISRSS